MSGAAQIMHTPSRAFQVERSPDQKRLPKFITCLACGNLIRRDQICWCCPEPEPARVKVFKDPMMGSESWATVSPESQAFRKRTIQRLKRIYGRKIGPAAIDELA